MLTDFHPAGHISACRPCDIATPPGPPASPGIVAPAPAQPRPRGARVALGGLMVLVVAALPVVAANARATSAESTYLRTVRDHSALAAVDDAELVDAGRRVCAGLDERPGRGRLAPLFDDVTAATGWRGSDAAVVVGAAVGALCPEHRALVAG